MKLSKTKKILLLGASIGILTVVVIPVVLINQNDNQEEQNQKDVDQVVKILEEKNENEKIIILPSNLNNKIIADNQDKIITKLKEIIGSKNLKETKIKVSMKKDQNISNVNQKIIITISKGKYSKTVASTKAYFVKREKNNQDITAELNNVKKALNRLTTKVVNVFSAENIDQKITTNKIEILEAIKEISGYSDIDFKGAKIEVKNSETLLPAANQNPVPITLVLSKDNVSIEVSGFKAKQ